MPVYEYRCNACQREFEYQQKMSDDDLVKCEACGEDKLERLISWPAFRMGGMGDASWTKHISGKMTAQQQREVARSLVDKHAPPKRPDKNPKAAAAAAATATTTATTEPATTADPEPAAETEAEAAGATPATPATDGDKE